ncbi:MAG TPA: YihY/virulence factor BrkB family protein [Gemmatimonadaceae bacterium]|nr:YihY/virulence factor BrkB family protein [Gemmatimonadaceae bacterium]
MARRSIPLWTRAGHTIRDYAKRVWDNAGEDNVPFLAGGIAFNILLAAVPFLLLLLAGLGYLLRQTTAQSSIAVWTFIERLLPPNAQGEPSPLRGLVGGIIAQRGAIGLAALIGFIWLSTRLFGSLRTVLAEVFDIEHDRGIIEGKIFDIKITIIATLLFVAYTVLTTYLNVATTRGVAFLSALGLRDEIMGRLEYVIGTSIAALFVLLMFFALYKFLPNRRIRWRSALLASLFTTVFFELARFAFTSYLTSFNPGSLYTGTLYTLVIVVFWVYYSAFIFIIGGEVGQVYELRRVRRLQRETLE